MAEPLHYDDPNADGNLTADEYRREHKRRAAELGDAGLHTIPDEFLAVIDGGADRK